MNAYTGAMGFPVNMPANFAPSGNAANAMRGPTPSQLANHNNPPMQTLYVRNLKAKRKAASMKEILKKKFKEHGTVTCVQVARTNRMRGQAFVSFDNVNEAMAAKDALDGQELDGLRIVVQFAKDKSDKLAKKDGTYVKRSQAEVKFVGTTKDIEADVMDEATDASSTIPLETMRGYDAPPEVELIPHKILFVQNLPDENPDDATTVADLFQQYKGFVETRMVPGKSGMAFVEFNTDEDAKEAYKALRGFRMNENILQISYAKK